MPFGIGHNHFLTDGKIQTFRREEKSERKPSGCPFAFNKQVFQTIIGLKNRRHSGENMFSPECPMPFGIGHCA
jgi:hypothetical protein